MVALLMGLQHALAMVGGLITPPLLVGALAFNDPTLSKTEAADRQNHLVASGLIVTGICTIVHVCPFSRVFLACKRRLVPGQIYKYGCTA